jgi:hypothetical protein
MAAPAPALPLLTFPYSMCFRTLGIPRTCSAGTHRRALGTALMSSLLISEPDYTARLAAVLLAHLIWLRSQSSSVMRTPYVILTRCSPFLSVYIRELIEQQIEMHFCLASSLTDHLSTLCIAEEVRVSTRL